MQTEQFIPLKDISSINLDQHIFIEASAGTGKTYTITRIFIRYILEKRIDYRKIILLTFTKKATQEMLMRVRELIETGIKEKQLDFLKNPKLSNEQIETLQEMIKYFDQLNISTIHSFCQSLLNEYPYELNIPSATELIDDYESYIEEILVNLLIQAENIGFDRDFIQKKSFEEIFTYTKIFIKEIKKREEIIIDFIDVDESILSREIFKNNFNKIYKEDYKELLKLLKYVYEELNKSMKYKGIFTYDDLILHLYNALKDNNNFRKKLQNEFQVCIVDEFQDTDPYQWRIFEWIFVENPSNRLVVVGDPKQSIYGFRGADFYAYENAKKQLNDKANFYKLEISYRSTPEFIELSNKFFEKNINNNNNKYSFPIKYYELKPSYQNKTNIYHKYHPINFIEIGSENAGDARNELSKKITAIIQDLVENHQIYDKKEEELRKIKYSDVAILVRSNKTDGDVISNLLKLKNIPFINYIKNSVFNSNEAYAMEFLLKFLAEGDSKSLKRFIVYYFIDIPYTDLSKIEEYYSKIYESISSWKNLLEQKKWYKLFYKIIEDTKLYYKFLAFPDYERKITNFEHIIEILVEAATKNHYGPIELYNYFKELKESEAHNTRLESEENKVHLLTMHSSKGLEFPIVFLMGWFNDKNPSVGMNYNYKFYDIEKKYWNVCFFYNNNKPVDIKNEIIKETFFEELRLLYVAFTRAQSYVFLPKYEKSNMKDFIANIAKEQEFEATILKEIPSTVGKKRSIRRIDSPIPQKFSIAELLEQTKQIDSIPYNEKRFVLNSYTSLTKYTPPTLEESDYDIDIEENTSQETSKIETEFDQYFKAGTKTGIFIHKLFEKIDFNDFKTPINKDYLLKKYKNLFRYFNNIYSIYTEEDLEPFYEYLVDFLEETLNHKINDEFALCEIQQDFLKKEIGFLIQDIKPLKEFAPIIERNFFTGNLDLFFEHNNKFYLLDYKTNKLNSYDLSTLKNFTETHYKIQYLLYSYALYLWLNQIKKINLKEKLPGGIIYYYVRGYKEPTKGIYYQDFYTFEEIHKQLKEILCKQP